MKRIVFILLSVLMLTSFIAMAQPAPTPAPDTPVATTAPVDDTGAVAPAPADAKPKTEEELITDPAVLAQQAEVAYNDWKTKGWIAGMAAVIGLLLLVLRFKPLDDALAAKGWKKYKVYFAIPLGALLGFFSSFATGAGWLPSIVAGIMAALLSPGIHQLFTVGNTK